MNDQSISCLVKCEHVAACANKCPRCVSWGHNGLIAIGSDQSIVICRQLQKNGLVKYKKVVQTLNRVEGRVNCVCWIRNMKEISLSSGSFLTSGSSNGTLTIWGCKQISDDSYDFDIMCSLQNHDGAITCIDAIIYRNLLNKGRNYLVATAGIDATIKLWLNSDTCIKSLSIFKEINLAPSLALTVSLHILNDQPIMACGLDNSKVNLYTFDQSKSDDKTICALSLIGHEDWVRGTDFVTLKNEDILLATCSQDCFIRLWRIAIQENHHSSDELKVKELNFEIFSKGKKFRYVVSLEAVLSGHEGWVYSVHWSMLHSENTPNLLSASMDKSVVLWKIDDESQIWIEDSRFGEVGGNTLGFYGACFSDTNQEIIAHSYNGALHLWEESTKAGKWTTGVPISGHFGDVLDISWEPKYGRYLVSTSADQTTRLFARWSVEKDFSWHEIARPQVHGYDMQSIAMIDSFRFISGADEKVLRIFEAPETFLENIRALTKVELKRSTLGPEGATVPALGLSNKAVFTTENSTPQETPTTRGEQYIENQFQKCLISSPPTEEYLLQNSLWPETHKLYSHVYEIFSVAANPTGTLVASAAKSSSPQHSNIVLWDTTSWKEVAQLQGHTLTVTQMEFSSDSKYLLSVSRDRTWILHEISGNAASGYDTRLLAKSDKKTGHGRIIWSTSWTHDSLFFCTGSRDKKVMFWKLCKIDPADEIESPYSGPVKRVLSSSFSVAITAVAFSKYHANGSNYLLATGKENGLIELNQFIVAPTFVCTTIRSFSIHDSHASCIKSLQWSSKVDDNKQYLASSSTDNMLKIYSISLDSVIIT